jgi:hypothetical protein
MNLSRHIVAAIMLTISAFCMVVYASCNKEKQKCVTTKCLNGGQCNDGKCVCPADYEGTYCEQRAANTCLDVACLNGGVCKEGNCSCPTGAGGRYCETVYRDTYINRYRGSGTDNATPANNYSDWQMTFNLPEIAPDITKLNMTLTGSTIVSFLHFTVTLSSTTDNGSVFTLSPFTTDSFSYTGSGTINQDVATLSLIRTEQATTKVTSYTCSGMLKQ